MSDQQGEGRLGQGVQRAGPRVQVDLVVVVELAQGVVEQADAHLAADSSLRYRSGSGQSWDDPAAACHSASRAFTSAINPPGTAATTGRAGAEHPFIATPSVTGCSVNRGRTCSTAVRIASRPVGHAAGGFGQLGDGRPALLQDPDEVFQDLPWARLTNKELQSLVGQHANFADRLASGLGLDDADEAVGLGAIGGGLGRSRWRGTDPARTCSCRATRRPGRPRRGSAHRQ